MKRLSILALSALTGTVGCTTTSQIPNDGRDNQRQELIQRENTELLRSISSSLSLLAKTKNSERISNLSADEMRKAEWMFSVTPQGMDAPITIEPWTGPLKQVVTMLADFSGYDVQEVGKPNGSERNVTVSSSGRMVRDALINVALQAGCDAEVRPVGASRTVIIDWTYRSRTEKCKK